MNCKSSSSTLVILKTNKYFYYFQKTIEVIFKIIVNNLHKFTGYVKEKKKIIICIKALLCIAAM